MFLNRLVNTLHLKFHVIIFRYNVAYGPDMSGAYLFMPAGNAVDAHDTEHEPTIYVIKGHILSQVVIQYSNVKHSVLLRHTKGNFHCRFLIFKLRNIYKRHF